MVVLEWNNAVKCLALAAPGLYADLLCDLKEGRDCAFQSHGAVIIKTVWYGSERYIWYLCDTGLCDMAVALMDLKQSNTDNLDIIRIYTGRCEGLHCLIYSRMGEPYTDRDIRPLSLQDGKCLRCFAETADGEAEIDKIILDNISKEFLHMQSDTSIRILGLFQKGGLAGVISVTNKRQGKVIAVNNVFVCREYRERGYAVRLIRAALALNPFSRYVYSCGSDNPASMASAISAGFVLEGTYVF